MPKVSLPLKLSKMALCNWFSKQHKLEKHRNKTEEMVDTFETQCKKGHITKT